MPSKQEKLRGSRFVLEQGDQHFPPSLACVHDPPQHLYGIGDPSALCEGIAIVGARKATPYGLANASYFARRAAARGVVVISGGARGCDAAAHRGALEVSGKTVVFLGGGCDCVYPAENLGLFQRIVDAGGAVVSEQTWTSAPLPWMFRMRNRLIAALARTILIVEAGLPSGTFSTADEALNLGKDVLAIPGAISAASSRGANKLIYQGACPIIDDDSFDDALLTRFACLKQENAAHASSAPEVREELKHSRVSELISAVCASPLGMEELYALACRLRKRDAKDWMMAELARASAAGLIARYPDGRWGPVGLNAQG